MAQAQLCDACQSQAKSAVLAHKSHPLLKILKGQSGATMLFRSGPAAAGQRRCPDRCCQAAQKNANVSAYPVGEQNQRNGFLICIDALS